MVDPQLQHLRMGACTRRIAPASTGTKANLPWHAAESDALLGADPPRRHRN
jgi:hypothetical protein